MSTVKVIGNRIAAGRKLRDVKQEVLARQLGIPQAMMSRYEHGHFATVNAERLLAIAEALDVSLDWLYGRIEHPKGSIA